MSKIIIKKDDTFLLRKVFPNEAVKELPKGVYTIELTVPEGEINLIKEGTSFKIPRKVYGDIDSNVDIIHDTWKEEGSLGVIASGLHGAGKTLLAERTANRFIAKEGMAVIKIDQPYSVQIIEQVIKYVGNCIIYLDEFGKLYGGPGPTISDKKYSQDNFLNLFSNKEYDKVIFIITCNNAGHELNKFFLDRPGRFKFHFKYESVPEDVIESIMHDYAVPESLCDEILEYSRINCVSIDVIKELIRLSVKCKNITELKNKIKIYNIPEFPRRTVSVVEATFPLNPDLKIGEFKCTIENDEIVIHYPVNYRFNLNEANLKHTNLTNHFNGSQRSSIYSYVKDDVKIIFDIECTNATDFRGPSQENYKINNSGHSGDIFAASRSFNRY